MANYDLQIKLNMVSVNPEDASTNTWGIIADDDAAAILATQSFLVFYDTIRTGYSNLVSQGPHEYKLYRRADPPPRAPIYQGPFSFTSAPTGVPLPTEVALCLSFQGARQSGVPQARRRGRVYLGPLATSIAGTNGRPLPTAITNIRNAAQALLTASVTSLSWEWSVYSPTSQSATAVTDGWVDDEWDTQRRRGRRSTARVTFT